MRAIEDNPELGYLEEHLNPVLVRKPSECAPQETDEFGERKFSITEGNELLKVSLLGYCSVGLKLSLSKHLLIYVEMVKCSFRLAWHGLQTETPSKPELKAQL